MENHEASNSNDMSQQVAVPALGIAPVAEETSHVDPADSIGRSALMTQLTRPADEMLQVRLKKNARCPNFVAFSLSQQQMFLANVNNGSCFATMLCFFRSLVE